MEQNSPEVNGVKQFGVITTTSATNLQDYFAQKMASLRRSRSDAQLNDEKHRAEGDSRPESLEIDDCNAVTVSPLKKKKKRAKMSESATSSEFVEFAGNVDSADKPSDDPIGKEKKRNKKKKKRKDLDQSNSVNGEIVTPGDLNEMTVKSSKKRKKKREDLRGIGDDDFHLEKFVEDEDLAVPDSTVDKCRRKKRKKCVNADKIDDDDESSRTSDTVRPKNKKCTKS